jgi:GAF domain-containing protein
LDEPAKEIEAVYLVDRGTSYPVRRAPLGQGISSRIIESGKPLFIRTFAEADALGTLTMGEGEQPPSVLAVPMTLVGKAVGMLSVQNYQPNAYTEEDLQILGTLGNQAIIAIQNARLLGETQNLASQLEVRVVERTAQLQREQQNTETLLRILTEVSSSLDLDRALNRTLSLLNEAIGAEQGTIMLVHAEDNLLHYRAGYGYLTDRTDTTSRGFTMKIGEGLAGWVVQNREAVLVSDLHQDARWVRSKSGQDHRSGRDRCVDGLPARSRILQLGNVESGEGHRKPGGRGDQ